jgi:rRNA-processing protein FCF1
MKNDKLIFIGTSVLLQKCIEITLKHYKNVFVITGDKQVKKIFKNKVKFIKINQIQKIKADYLFSVLNKKIINFDQIKTIKKISLNFHD